MSRSGSGGTALDRLGACFVGTIHAYCFRLLQQHVPRYETYDVLDDNQLTAFLCARGDAAGHQGSDGRLFASIRAFLANVDVVENELIAGIRSRPTRSAAIVERYSTRPSSATGS